MGSRTRQCKYLLEYLSTTRLFANIQGILREFYRYRHNLVLDSLCPSLAPHIVVTPPDEVWNDNLITPWQNRVDFQQTEYLTVPHTFLSDLYPSSEGHPGHATLEDKPQISADSASILFYGPKPVFSTAGFTKHVHALYKPSRLVSRILVLDRQCFR